MTAARRLSVIVAILTIVPSVTQAQGCLSNPARLARSTSHHSSTRIDDDKKSLTVWWQRGECELRVDARGDFAVRADLSGFTSIDQGGYVDIEERDGDRERRVRVTNSGGRLQYRWTLDGADGFDVDRERWLAGILVSIERRTAMFAKSRIPELLRQGGPEAVLAETERMEGDYARRVYYTTLLASTKLTDPQVERLLKQAGDNMTSDYERAELLRAVAKQGPMSDRITRGVIGVAQLLSSDYEKRRALSAGLESVNSAESRAALFVAASSMS